MTGEEEIEELKMVADGVPIDVEKTTEELETVVDGAVMTDEETEEPEVVADGVAVDEELSKAEGPVDEPAEVVTLVGTETDTEGLV